MLMEANEKYKKEKNYSFFIGILNVFHGSLGLLKNLTKLQSLSIIGCNGIDEGLNLLSLEHLTNFECRGTTYEAQLEQFGNNIKRWRAFYENYDKNIEELQKQLKNTIALNKELKNRVIELEISEKNLKEEIESEREIHIDSMKLQDGFYTNQD